MEQDYKQAIEQLRGILLVESNHPQRAVELREEKERLLLVIESIEMVMASQRTKRKIIQNREEN